MPSIWESCNPIPTEKRKGLQSQIQECLFVGYSEDSKGYNLIIMSTQKTFIERSVQFEEEPMVAAEIGEYSSGIQDCS